MFEQQKISFYEDDYFYYFWKPYGIPSTPWKEESFLDWMKSALVTELPYNNRLPRFTRNDEKIRLVIKFLNTEFWLEQELGLVNRLDNDTSWILYFAKSKQIFEDYKNLQSLWQVEKIYLADVSWNFRYDFFQIDFPIMHHIQIAEKMIVIKSEKDLSKWRWQQHKQITYIEKLYYDEQTNSSTLKVIINKWIRHQIRAHLSSIGYPIVGDKLYNKKYIQGEELRLISIWLSI